MLLAVGVGLALLGPLAPAGAQTGGDRPTVLVTTVDDPITPVIADHLADVVAAAEDEGHAAVVVELDTPGGLDTAMRDIVQTFLRADVPVVVYVTPSGARAASAGALIAWSAHVVAMAPGTTIGAATPVDLEGGEVGDKVVNDAAAYARAVAEERGRDVEVAEEAVTEGRALSASEAVDEGVADLIAVDRPELLQVLDGTRVELPDGTTVTLETGGAEVVERDMSAFRRLLQWLADPNLAFLFLSLGTLAIIYELATPGIGVGGGLGAVLLVLALFSLAVLPVDAVGLVFLVVAAVLFVVEVLAPGIGAAAALGAVSLALAGVFLFRDEGPGVSLSLAAVVPVVVVVGGAVVLAGRLAAHARTAPSVLGPEALVGRQVTVARADGSSGQAFVEGAWWAVSGDEPLAPGDEVRIRDVDGLRLLVDRLPTEDTKDTEDAVGVEEGDTQP